MTGPACMTADEWRTWREGGRYPWLARKNAPCDDCPAWFAAEQRAQGACNGEPADGITGRHRGAPSDDPRVNRRRQQWRESTRRRYARMREGAA